MKNNRPLTKKEIEELAKLEEKVKSKKAKAKPGGKKKKNGHEIAADQVLATQKQAAEYAGVSTRTVRRWKNEDMPLTKEGKYIKAMLDHYKRNEGKETTPEKKRTAVAVADIKETNAKLRQMELEIKQGELVRREDLDKKDARKVLAVKRALLGLGRKVADRLSRLRDPHKIQAVIDTETKEIIAGFAGE